MTINDKEYIFDRNKLNNSSSNLIGGKPETLPDSLSIIPEKPKPMERKPMENKSKREQSIKSNKKIRRIRRN